MGRFLLILLVISSTIMSCKRSSYDVEFSKRISQTNYTSHFNKYQDSLLIYFEDDFDMDIVEVKSNTGFHSLDTIETSNIGIANVLILGLRDEIDYFSININSRRQISIDVDTSYNFVAVNYFGDLVTVEYLTKSPMYE